MVNGRCDDNPDFGTKVEVRTDVEGASPTIVFRASFRSRRRGSRISFCHKVTARNVR
jgi:hypothetical protein